MAFPRPTQNKQQQKPQQDQQQQQQQKSQSQGIIAPRKSRKQQSFLFSIILLVLLGVSGFIFIHSTFLVSSYYSSSSIPTTTSGSFGAISNSLKEFGQKTNSKNFKKQNNNDNIDHDNDDTFFDPHANIIEDPIPNPPLSNGNVTFSACLLVMDDNHRLVEWLAYHYHVLPLRTLIIAVDPRSKTSPTHYLNKWRQFNMYIEEWDDYNIFREAMAKNIIADDAELQIKRDRHRSRQKNFYRNCLFRMKQLNRTFTTLIDTDEFLTYNHKGGDLFESWEQEQNKIHEQYYGFGKQRIRPFHTPPSTNQSGAMIQYILQEKQAGHPFYQSACISCPRLQFGAQEEEENENENNKVQKHHGKYFDPDRFDTLRFRKHAPRNDFVKNGLSKVIIDVSNVPNLEKVPKFQTLHRPIKTICSAPWKNEWESGLRINHYLGSWESYSFRDDSRRGGERSKEGWTFKSQDAEETDDIIQPWFDGFVAEHGIERSKHLLKHAGLPKSYKNPNETAWTIMFLDEILSVNETKGNEVRVKFDNFVREMHGVGGNNSNNNNNDK